MVPWDQHLNQHSHRLWSHSLIHPNSSCKQWFDNWIYICHCKMCDYADIKCLKSCYKWHPFDSLSFNLLQIHCSCLISISIFIYTSNAYIIMIPSLDWFSYVERKLMFYVYMWLFVYMYFWFMYFTMWTKQISFFKGSIKLDWIELNWSRQNRMHLIFISNLLYRHSWRSRLNSTWRLHSRLWVMSSVSLSPTAQSSLAPADIWQSRFGDDSS